jgi:hypothetical protein
MFNNSLSQLTIHIPHTAPRVHFFDFPGKDFWVYSCDMTRNSLNVVIIAVAALLLVFMVLLFISINPWQLYGISAVLLAISEIVKAINGPSGRDRLDRRGAADQRELIGRGNHAEKDADRDDDTGEPDGAHNGDDGDQSVISRFRAGLNPAHALMDRVFAAYSAGQHPEAFAKESVHR